MNLERCPVCRKLYPAARLHSCEPKPTTGINALIEAAHDDVTGPALGAAVASASAEIGEAEAAALSELRKLTTPEETDRVREWDSEAIAQACGWRDRRGRLQLWRLALAVERLAKQGRLSLDSSGGSLSIVIYGPENTK